MNCPLEVLTTMHGMKFVTSTKNRTTTFSRQGKDVVFLDTSLPQRHIHSLVECIPLSREIAPQAPLYFKKAIDEAEDEWSQYNAKELIVYQRIARCSIPNHFP